MHFGALVLSATLLGSSPCFSFGPKAKSLQRRIFEDDKDKSPSVLSLPLTSITPFPLLSTSAFPKDDPSVVFPASTTLKGKGNDRSTEVVSTVSNNDKASTAPSKDVPSVRATSSSTFTSEDDKPSRDSSVFFAKDKDRTQPNFSPTSPPSRLADKGSSLSTTIGTTSSAAEKSKDKDKTSFVSGMFTNSPPASSITNDKDQDKSSFSSTTSTDTTTTASTMPSKDISTRATVSTTLTTFDQSEVIKTLSVTNKGASPISSAFVTGSSSSSSTSILKDQTLNGGSDKDKDKSTKISNTSSSKDQDMTSASVLSPVSVFSITTSQRSEGSSTKGASTMTSTTTATTPSQTSVIGPTLLTTTASLKTEFTFSSSRSSVQTSSVTSSSFASPLTLSVSKLSTSTGTSAAKITILRISTPTKSATRSSTSVPPTSSFTRSLTLTSEPPFLNASSSIVPLWTSSMLDNAYGGGYTTTPSVYITLGPTPNGSIHGIPPGYGSSTLLVGSILSTGFATPVSGGSTHTVPTSGISIFSQPLKDRASSTHGVNTNKDKTSISKDFGTGEVSTGTATSSRGESSLDDKSSTAGVSIISGTRTSFAMASVLTGSASSNTNATLQNGPGGGSSIVLTRTSKFSATVLTGGSGNPLRHVSSKEIPLNSKYSSLLFTTGTAPQPGSISSSLSLSSSVTHHSSNGLTSLSGATSGPSLVGTDQDHKRLTKALSSSFSPAPISSTGITASTALGTSAKPELSVTTAVAGPSSTEIAVGNLSITVPGAKKSGTNLKSTTTDQTSDLVLSTFQSPKEGGLQTSDKLKDVSTAISGPITVSVSIIQSASGTPTVPMSGSTPKIEQPLASTIDQSQDTPSRSSGTFSTSFSALLNSSLFIESASSLVFTIKGSGSVGETSTFPSTAVSGSSGLDIVSDVSTSAKGTIGGSVFPIASSATPTSSCQFVSASASPTPANSCCSYLCGAALVPFNFCSLTDGTGQFQACSKCPGLASASSPTSAASPTSLSPSITATTSDALSISGSTQESYALKGPAQGSSGTVTITPSASLISSISACPDQSSFRVNCPATFNSCCSFVCGGKALPFGSSICLSSSGVAPIETCLQCLSSPVTNTFGGFDKPSALPASQEPSLMTNSESGGPSSVTFVNSNGATLTTPATEIPRNGAATQTTSQETIPESPGARTAVSQISSFNSGDLGPPSSAFASIPTGSAGQVIFSSIQGSPQSSVASLPNVASSNPETNSEAPTSISTPISTMSSGISQPITGGGTQISLTTISIIPTKGGPPKFRSSESSDNLSSSPGVDTILSPGSTTGSETERTPKTLLGSSTQTLPTNGGSPQSQASSTEAATPASVSGDAPITSLVQGQPLVSAFPSGGSSFGNSSVPFRPFPIPIQEFPGLASKRPSRHLSLMLFFAAFILFL